MRGTVNQLEHQAPYFISAPVQANRTGESIAALLEQYNAFLGDRGVTPEELERTINGNTRSLAGGFETSAQLLGARSFRFALLPHAGTWLMAGVAAAAERYRHPFVVIRSAGPAEAQTVPVTGLQLGGDGAVLSAVRRRGDWLEIRVVNEAPTPCRATLGLAIAEAREADVLGRAGVPLPVSSGGPLTLDLGPWEIRTVQVR